MKIQTVVLGTWHSCSLPKEKFKELIKDAVKIGYFIIDTAESYCNTNSESMLGEVLREIDRDKIMIISKLGPNHLSYEDVLKYGREISKRIGSRVDVLLSHVPNPNIDLRETLDAMRELKKEGTIRMFGLSNYSLKDIYIGWKNGISVVENELNLLYHDNLRELEFCNNHGIAFLAYRALAGGELLKEPYLNILTKIGKEYNKTPSQVAIKWIIQKGAFPIVGSSKANHLIEDLNIDWYLSKYSMRELDKNFKIN